MNGVIRLRSFCVLLSLVFPLLLAGPQGRVLAQPDEKSVGWPQFLGPHRNGISDEKGLLKEWPAAGPKVVWRVAGGVGMSGLAIRDNRVVSMIQRDGKQWVICLEKKSGATIWQTPVAPAYKNGMGNGPRATPTISGDQVAVFTGEGILASLNVADGRILWSRDLTTELQGTIADYGMACSPLVIGSLVVVTTGAPGAAIVACDVASGRIQWKSGDDAAGYSSPALLEISGQKQLVVYTGQAAVGLVPQSGAELWRYPFVTNFDCNIATPIAVNNHVLISSGENHGAVLLALKKSGTHWTVSETWQSLGAQSVLRNEWQTSIASDGYLYGFDNVGAAGPVTHLTCVKAATGERVWQKTRFGKGNMIAADGKLFASTMNGDLVVVKLSPDSYQEIGRTQLTGPTRQAPALSEGFIYLRDNEEIVCVDVRETSE